MLELNYITTHGHTLAEVQKRPFMMKSLTQNIFERFIELRDVNPGRGATKFLDAAGDTIYM